MDTVVLVEQALRQHLQPIKINIASLGNQVAHLHWHVIARFAWDSRFPNPVWAAPQRPRDSMAVANVLQRLTSVEQQIQREIC